MQDEVEIPRTFFTIGAGRTPRRIMVRAGQVANLNLGTFFEEPPFEVAERTRPSRRRGAPPLRTGRWLGCAEPERSTGENVRPYKPYP